MHFAIFEHFPRCTWSFAVLTLNSNVRMLVTSCINFHETILYINVFIPILKVAC